MFKAKKNRIESVPHWSTMAAKRLETRSADSPWGDKSVAKRVQAARQALAADPEDYRHSVETERELLRAALEGGMADRTILSAETDASLRPLQCMVEELCQANVSLLPQAPRLLVHTPNSFAPEISEEGLYASLPTVGYIQTNAHTVEYARTHPRHFRVMLSHELAHSANGDLSTESVIRSETQFPTHHDEVLADRLGAIIFGNPLEYARLTQQMVMDSWPYARHESTANYLSPNAQVRMLHKWAKILQDQKALNPDGTVILPRALEVFAHSRTLTGRFSRISSELQGLA